MSEMQNALEFSKKRTYTIKSKTYIYNLYIEKMYSLVFYIRSRLG
jgi:hypothetical protein